MPSAKFPAQLIAMVSDEVKAGIASEAAERDVSISEVVRDRLDLAQAAKKGRVLVHTVYPDAESAQDAMEQIARNLADEFGRVEADDHLRIISPAPQSAIVSELPRIGRAPRDSTRP